ncbi:MAG: hypothetical protein IPO91_17270 [Chloroflexi bacterium]|nr:hypothetical protein [Chloroflexota bacterium]
MKLYYVFIYRPGPNWLPGKPINEQPLTGHFEYMSRLQAQGKLMIGGGFVDNSGAMGVFLAEDIEQARDIVFADPVVRDKIVTAEVHPWLVTVPGCVGMEAS